MIWEDAVGPPPAPSRPKTGLNIDDRRAPAGRPPDCGPPASSRGARRSRTPRQRNLRIREKGRWSVRPLEGSAMTTSPGGGSGSCQITGSRSHHAHRKSPPGRSLLRHHARGLLGRSRRPPGPRRPRTQPLRPRRPRFRIFLRIFLAAGDIVQEKRGLRAAADHVVDAHATQSMPMVFVAVQQLGPDGFSSPRRRCRRPGMGGAIPAVVQLEQPRPKPPIFSAIRRSWSRATWAFHQFHRSVTGR